MYLGKRDFVDRVDCVDPVGEDSSFIPNITADSGTCLLWLRTLTCFHHVPQQMASSSLILRPSREEKVPRPHPLWFRPPQVLKPWRSPGIILGADASRMGQNLSVEVCGASSSTVFVTLSCTFRYGRDDMDVMGIAFHRELYLSTRQVYPPLQDRDKATHTKVQAKLLRKLGEHAYPFFFEVGKVTRVLQRPERDQDLDLVPLWSLM